MAKVFLYNIQEEKRGRLLAVLRRRGIPCREPAYREYGHPLGYLCGREGFAPAPDYTGPDFSDEMLLLEGLSSHQLSALLDELRSQGAAVALKAIVTDTNAAWSSALLHAAILEEHRAMQALQTKAKRGNAR